MLAQNETNAANVTPECELKYMICCMCSTLGLVYTDIQHSGIPDADIAHTPLWMTHYESDHLSGSC